MFADAILGSKVALLDWKKIVGQATIDGETACYWLLSNDQRVKKDLGYYWESHNKSKRIEVELWSQEFEAKYQAHIEKEQAASALAAQKSQLYDYIEYMRTGYLGRLSSHQIAAILLTCQEQIGNISTPRIR